MPGIDFNRQAFVPSDEKAPQPATRLLGAVFLLVVLLVVAVVGYKVIASSARSEVSADAQGLEKIQQHLTEMEKRLDLLEKRRRVPVAEPIPTTSATHASNAPSTPAPKRPAFKVSAASVLPTAPNPLRTSATQGIAAASPAAGASAESAADREAWQATTDRLADVVGVVGSQEGEITQTREQLNALLSQTRRSAVQFDLRRGSVRQSVGPVSMVLKGSDPRSQRYTVCVYMDDKCVELKDRTVNEVVVFVVSRNSAPLELVATKILRDQIIGYLEIPTEKSMP
jgi:hypothetical protein